MTFNQQFDEAEPLTLSETNTLYRYPLSQLTAYLRRRFLEDDEKIEKLLSQTVFKVDEEGLMAKLPEVTVQPRRIRWFENRGGWYAFSWWMPSTNVAELIWKPIDDVYLAQASRVMPNPPWPRR